jgi:molecular chaperone GrpE
MDEKIEKVEKVQETEKGVEETLENSEKIAKVEETLENSEKIEEKAEETLENSEKTEEKVIEKSDETVVEVNKAINNLNKSLISQLQNKNSDLNLKLEKSKKETEDMKIKYVRLLADFENVKKRTKKEVQDIRKYSTTSLLKDFLPIIDNMQRALEHSKLDDTNPNDPLIEGIKLVHKQFISTLEKYLVTPFESLNKPFDPKVHEALQMMETEDFEDNMIVNEYEKGYFIGERLLRPAKVIVAKNISKK